MLTFQLCLQTTPDLPGLNGISLLKALGPPLRRGHPVFAVSQERPRRATPAGR
jgi:hypothetical protein